MISAVAWIPKGAARGAPGAADFTEEELAAAAANEVSTAGEDSNSHSDTDLDSGEGEDYEAEATQIAQAKAVAAALRSSSGLKKDAAPFRDSEAAELDAAMAELDMENYDEDSEEDGGGMYRVFGNSNPGLMYYANNEADPYLKLAAVSDDDSEAEDMTLREDDFVLLAARNQDDVSHLEVWVYEPAEQDQDSPNLYVHHDLLLPAFPLALAWLDCSPSGRQEAGNFAAIGTMNPGIEIWDLDVLDSVEPAAVLGGSKASDGLLATEEASAKAKKKKKVQKKRRKEELKEGSHTDAVMGLSWNREYRNVLASASADGAVKVWDMANQRCQATLSWHKGKVQAVAWNPADPPVLLSGGFDRRVFLGDARTPNGQPLQWETSSDVEALAWDPHNPTRFLVSSEDGIIAALDARAGGGAAPLFRLAAHDKPACCLAFNPVAKNLIATASTDKTVKLWDLSQEPVLLASRDLQIGAIFSAAFCAEQPSLFAAGGAKGDVKVWDILSQPSVAAKYGKALTSQTQIVQSLP